MTTFSDAPVTLVLLITIVLVSLSALLRDGSLLERLSFVPSQRGQPHRWVTSAFIHAGFWHLAFNVITLYYFGPVVEARLGSAQFLFLYGFSLLACSFVTYRAHRDNPAYAAVGASGAVMGVVVAYSLFEPWSLLYFFGIVPLPALLFVGGFAGFSWWAMRTGRLPGIAHEGHLGGVAGGILTIVILEPQVVRDFFRQLLL